MEEFFVPNFAFLVFCKTQDYYLAYQLVNWSVVDYFVFWIGFEVFCEDDVYEDIAEYCLKKYILEKIFKDEIKYKNGYLWKYLNKTLKFHDYLGHVYDFIRCQLQCEINDHNWQRAKWFHDLIPINTFDVNHCVDIAGISYRDPIRNYILECDLKLMKKVF